MIDMLLDIESLLEIDVGSVTTRASLFDVVGDSYRYLGSGSATTQPTRSPGLPPSIRQAIAELGEVTGRVFLDQTGEVIRPYQADNVGVDAVAATVSIGQALRILVVGLLGDVSVERARRLALTTYCSKIEILSLEDTRRPEEIIAAILDFRADLIIVAGGVNQGAGQSLLDLLDPICLACSTLPEETRPPLLYAGNQALQEEVNKRFEGVLKVHHAPNIQPTLEAEQMSPAQVVLSEIVKGIELKRAPGLQHLNQITEGTLEPTANSFGRIIRFLSKDKSQAAVKGVLGIDIGVNATTLAAAYDGTLTQRIFPELGLTGGINHYLDEAVIRQISNWITLPLTEGYLKEYLANKRLYPANVPITPEDLAIEQALARYIMQQTVKKAVNALPKSALYEATSVKTGLLPWFEPIIVTGSVVAKAPSLPQSMLMVLDGLQPTGITTVVLDKNQILAALGVAAKQRPALAIQVLDSNALIPLGTVISPIGNARPGTPIVRLKTTYEDGHETILDVKQGMLEVLPLPVGQTARIQIQPLHRYDVGMGGAGRGGTVKVMGSALGIIIDGRGRPLVLPRENHRRVDLLKKWLWTLGR